jgi:hypothetical protein
MATFIGKLVKKEVHAVSELHQKTVATLVSDDNQKLFVEFRGDSWNSILNKIPENSKAIVSFKFDGKQSERSGQYYNNLVALSIEKA